MFDYYLKMYMYVIVMVYLFDIFLNCCIIEMYLQN